MLVPRLVAKAAIGQQRHTNIGSEKTVKLLDDGILVFPLSFLQVALPDGLPEQRGGSPVPRQS
jgi:hypothetical protein